MNLRNDDFYLQYFAGQHALSFKQAHLPSLWRKFKRQMTLWQRTISGKLIISKLHSCPYYQVEFLLEFLKKNYFLCIQCAYSCKLAWSSISMCSQSVTHSPALQSELCPVNIALPYTLQTNCSIQPSKHWWCSSLNP